MRIAVVLAALAVPPLAAGCGGEHGGARPAAPSGGATLTGGPPDAGTRYGHGVRPARHKAVRVPELDRTPPLALLRMDQGDGAPPVVHDSPVRARRAPPITLRRPGFTATATIRDADGGTGRIRVSVEYSQTCPQAGGGAPRQSLHGRYFPSAQIVRVKIAPGALVPAERSRRARLRFPAHCAVAGKVFAEATNAQGLESFSDPIWFRYRPAG